MDQVWLWNLCLVAASAAAVGDAPLGRTLLPLLLPHARQHANMVFATLGSVTRYVALLQRLLGRMDEAEHSLLEAEEANDAIGAVSWLARTRLDLAELRFERFGRANSLGRAALDHAAEAAAKHGLSNVADRAARLASL
jgi:hypothetical protein